MSAIVTGLLRLLELVQTAFRCSNDSVGLGILQTVSASEAQIRTELDTINARNEAYAAGWACDPVFSKDADSRDVGHESRIGRHHHC